MPIHPYQTTRIWKQTHRRLRIIAAHAGESIVEVLDRLARQEFQRLGLSERDGLDLPPGVDRVETSEWKRDDVQ